MVVMQHIYSFKKDGKTTTRQELSIFPIKKGVKGFFAPACQPLCNQNLRRPHLTLINCRTRKVYYGRPTKDRTLKVKPVVFYIPENMPWWKHLVLKAIRSIYAVVAG